MLLAAAMLPVALMLHLALASISEKLLKEWIGPKGLQYLKLSVVSLDESIINIAFRYVVISKVN